MDATRPRAVSYLLTGKAPQWRPFGHMDCENALSDALRRLLRKLAHPHSSGRVDSLFFHRGLSGSPAVTNLQLINDMQLSKWLRANVDFAFQAVFPAVRAVSLLIFIIPQGNRKVYYFLQDFIFFHKILLLSAPHRFTAFASDLGQIRASEGRNAAADWAERGK